MAEAKPEKKEEKLPTGKEKKKKINRMTAQEIDKKLDEVKQKMGNLTSRYALELIKRKRQLLGQENIQQI